MKVVGECFITNRRRSKLQKRPLELISQAKELQLDTPLESTYESIRHQRGWAE